MFDLKEIPKLQMILDAQTYLTGVWSTAHGKWRERDSFYNRDYSVWTKEAHRRVRGNLKPGRPTAIVDHAADTALQFTPTFHREPVGDSDDHKMASDNLEKGLSSVMMDSAMREPVQVWKQIGRYGLHLGYKIVEGPLWSERDKPTEPKRKNFDSEDEFKLAVAIFKVEKKFWNPIRIRATHPARVLMDPEDKMPRMAVKMGRMLNYKIYELSKLKKKTHRRKHSILFDMEQLDEYGYSDTIDFWTENWHTFMAAGEIIYSERNMGGFVPFAHAFDGFGMEPTDLEQVNPEYLAVGLLSPVMDDIRMEAQRINAQHELMNRRAYAQLGTTGDPHELQQSMAEAGIVQGEDGSVWLMPSPAVEGWMFRMGQETADDIELSTYAKPISGGKQAGVETVGQQQILSNAATRKFAGPAMQNEDMASLTASRVLRLVDVGGDIGAKGEILRRSDIFHSYHIVARFELLDPVLDLQRKEQGMRLFREKLIGWEDYHVDYMGTQDLTSVRKHLWEDVVRSHPGVASQLAQVAADRIGLGKEFRQATEAEAAALTEGSGIPGQAEMAQSSLSPSVNGPRQPLTDRDAKPERPNIG
jgi:hypothetical protein